MSIKNQQYGLAHTAKANGLAPSWHLQYFFERLMYAKATEQYKALLPYAIVLKK